MCGICGFTLTRRPDYDPAEILSWMNEELAHRGPDADGFWSQDGVHLGHRRLSIIDLETGAQPMSNEDGSVVIVFNGEIYNHLALREGLLRRGHIFKTRSDTEVLVHLWEEKGVELPEFIEGMFALAIWDRKQKSLFLARDRMGKKPLYWHQGPGVFMFASELGSLLQHPRCPRALDPLSVRRYLLFDCVPAPGCILAGVQKLEPGCCLLLSDGKVTIRRYWDMLFPALDQKAPTLPEASEQLRELLLAAVKKRLMSDVPLGVFLSGGIDSSMVVALLSKLMPGPEIKTFSIGFKDASFDESRHAQRVAAHFRTDHHLDMLSPELMLQDIGKIMGMLDEPLADNSLLPTFLLCRFARQHVTVALGGDGGDELALGYPTFKAHGLARQFERLPAFVHSAARKTVSLLPVSHRNISLDYQARRFVKGLEYDRFGRHFVWIGALAPDEQHRILASSVLEAVDDVAVLDIVREHTARCAPRDDLDMLIYLYSKIYMCDDILCKADRASMMNSLELRAPILDREVVEFLCSLPNSYKYRYGEFKYIFKYMMQEELPQPILRRPKKGFGVPIARWLRGELRDWATEILSAENIDSLGVLNPEGVSELFAEHLAGARDNRKPLWSIIVLLLWHQAKLSGVPHHVSRETRLTTSSS